jgi:hypothetical protein
MAKSSSAQLWDGEAEKAMGPDAGFDRSPRFSSSPLPKRPHGQKVVAAAEKAASKAMLLAKVTMSDVSSCAAESS